jgi:hypothetical protein
MIATAQFVAPKIDNITIIAGTKNISKDLISHLKKQKYNFIVIALNLSTYLWSKAHGVKAYYCSLTRIGKIVDLVTQHQCFNVVMIGKVLRPNLVSLTGFDFESRQLLAYLNNLQGGDNYIFNKIIEFCEQKYNFKVIAAQQLMNNETLAQNIDKLDEKQFNNWSLGQKFFEKLSEFDIGQAIVIFNQHIVAVEGSEGTDEMLKRVKKFNNKLPKKYEGMLIKLPKKEQNIKIDLPTIGPSTIKLCNNINIRVIIIHHLNCFVAEKNKTFKLAQKYNIKIIAV